MMRGLIIGIFMLMFAQRLSACLCKQLEPLSKAVTEKYDVIFLGQVVAVSPNEDQSRARFRVTSLYRGKAYAEMDVDYDLNSDCALNFVPGETWIIYGRWVEYGIPETDMCTHSRVKPKEGQEDFFAIDGRTAFDKEVKWLNDSLGVQSFIDPEQKKDLGHKNQLPDPTQAIVYIAVGLAGLGLIFFFVSRMFKRDGK